MNFLKLIRYQNLIMLALMQLIFRYGFLRYQDVYLFLNNLQFGLLVVATVLIAGAGYIINDIMDQETDADNKPERITIGKGISEAMGYNLYFVMNVTGVGIGFYLSNVIQKPTFGGIFIIIVTLLYLYATSFKKMLLVGNIIVALVLSISILIIGLFDLLPLTSDLNRNEMGVIFAFMLTYALLAFLLNFIREIVKDMEDVDGDYNQGMNTLPIALGVNRTAKVVVVLGLLVTLLLLWYINSYLMANELYYVVIYSLVVIVAPMLFFVVKMWGATSKKEYHNMSTLLKWVIFFGILSVAVISFNIRIHA